MCEKQSDINSKSNVISHAVSEHKKAAISMTFKINSKGLEIVVPFSSFLFISLSSLKKHIYRNMDALVL